jgi:glycosyltransferase involved in cell wall biosynthesis
MLDIDDPEHIRNTRRLQTLGLVVDPRTEADIAKLRRFEQTAVAGAKLAFVCQANDQDGWATPPEVVPNCIPVPTDPPRNVSKPIVLFVGNCAGSISSPNVDAVRFFLAEVWPKVKTAVPAAEFHIVGATSDVVRQPAQNAPGVVVRGFVDDLEAVYAESSVSVAPIRFGTGTRIKILDAFAHACPVVSTLPGAEGIAAVPGAEIELAAGPEDFVALTVALLNDPNRNRMIGQNGHALALREYDSTVQQRKLETRFKEFLTLRQSEGK